MILKFKTKPNVNGNIYTLIIDTGLNRFYTDYNPYYSGDYIELKKRDLMALIKMLESNNFTKTGF